MQQKNSHASLCTVKHHMAPTGQTLQVNFSSASAKRYPVGVLHANEFTRSPFGARHCLSGSRSPCYGKTTAQKPGMWCTHRPSTGNYVTATHQEGVATSAQRLGNWMPPEKQLCFHSLLGRGGAQPANFFPQGSKGVADLVKTRLGWTPGNLPKVAHIMGAVFGNYPPKARPFRPPLGGAPVVGIDEGRKGNHPRAQRPVAQV